MPLCVNVNVENFARSLGLVDVKTVKSSFFDIEASKGFDDLARRVCQITFSHQTNQNGGKLMR